MTELSDHWNERYGNTDESGVGWFQPVPSTLDLVLKHASSASRVVDVGAGKSRLVDHLIAEGISDVTLLDLAAVAFDEVKERLGSNAGTPTFVEADLRAWNPSDTYDLWHDRAVIHFMVAAADQKAYAEALDRALGPNGVAVIAAFAEDGPDMCAGLPVQRHTPASLATMLSSVVKPLSSRRSSVAQSGDGRPYIECVFTR